MSRAVIILNTDAERRRAVLWINNAPAGTRIEFKAAKRSTDQNARMWAMLTDIATQLEWKDSAAGRLNTNDWKLLFLDALKRETRTAMALEGDGAVNLGRSSSDLSKAEMSDMIELMHAFGAKHGVTFHDSEAA